MNRLMVCAGLGALAAAGILGTAKAEATPLSYVQSLNAHGLTVYDTAAALRTGYAICSMLNTDTGDVVAEYVYRNTSWSDVPDVDTAVQLTVVSVEELCPWHDHRAGDFVA